MRSFVQVGPRCFSFETASHAFEYASSDALLLILYTLSMRARCFNCMRGLPSTLPNIGESLARSQRSALLFRCTNRTGDSCRGANVALRSSSQHRRYSARSIDIECVPSGGGGERTIPSSRWPLVDILSMLVLRCCNPLLLFFPSRKLKLLCHIIHFN